MNKNPPPTNQKQKNDDVDNFGCFVGLHLISSEYSAWDGIGIGALCWERGVTIGGGVLLITPVQNQKQEEPQTGGGVLQ